MVCSVLFLISSLSKKAALTLYWGMDLKSVEKLRKIDTTGA